MKKRLLCLILVLFTCRVIIPYFLPKVKSIFLFFHSKERKIMQKGFVSSCAVMTTDGVDGAELQNCIIYFFVACNFRRAVVY